MRNIHNQDALDRQAAARAKERRELHDMRKRGRQMLKDHPEKKIFAAIKGHEERRRNLGEPTKITLPRLKFMEKEIIE